MSRAKYSCSTFPRKRAKAGIEKDDSSIGAMSWCERIDSTLEVFNLVSQTIPSVRDVLSVLKGNT
jgi:hypothetical protein